MENSKISVSECDEKLEKTNKPLTSVELVSMQVVDADGRFVGTVKQVFLQAGKSEYTLSVESTDGETQTIEWDAIQGAADYVLLKPVEQSIPLSPQSVKPVCPTCGKPLKWISQYQRWYCKNDQKYV